MTHKESRKVVLASRNPDKIRELQELLADTPFIVVGAGDYPGLPEVIEDGTTILGNARRKAMVTAAFTGEIALADDTSFGVRELNGWPDIFAARFAGSGATYASNAALVLELMDRVPDGARQARFSTSCVWLDPQPASPARSLRAEDYPVLSPAHRRWVRNPWFGTRPFHPHSSPVPREWDYWNTLSDRRAAWRSYATLMLSDLTSFGGHDPERLRAVAEQLLATCPDSPYFQGDGREYGGQGAWMRLPDPTLWTVRGPGHDDPAPSQFHPAGLAQEAPGRELCQPLWLEIGTGGTLTGSLTRQPIGGGGFGYDPIFRPAGSEQTLAELEPEAKHAVSHRGRALRRMLRAVHRAYDF